MQEFKVRGMENMLRKTLILTRSEIETLADYKMAIQCVEEVFGDYAKAKAKMPAKVYLDLKEFQGDFRAMPAYWERKNAVALKWVNAHPQNLQKDLPSVMAIVVLNDPRTGFPLCIMDGTYLTGLRTAAGGAVAAKYLAGKDLRSVGLVGCGVQARSQLMALRELFLIKKVLVWGHKEELIKKFIQEMKTLKEDMVGVDSIKDCVKDANLVVTTTPSRRPLVKFSWLKEGVHINAIGADAPGKQELDPKILKHAKIVVDDIRQAAHGGEINVPFQKGIITLKDIYATLGEIIAGKKKGRINNTEITVFDSTGLAIQDVACAHLIYKLALQRKKGRWVRII